MSQILVKEVKKIVSKKTGVKKEKITLSTTLGSDLGLDGDDALELLQEIQAEFKVSFNNLNFREYFNEEYDIWGVRNLFNKFLNKKNYISKHNNEITIEDLVKSIEAGTWTPSHY